MGINLPDLRHRNEETLSDIKAAARVFSAHLAYCCIGISTFICHARLAASDHSNAKEPLCCLTQPYMMM